ncbi:L,D-transpeptidase, partial [[Clostridium] symbiosum]
VEAFQIQLTGDAERLYDVYYSATSTGQGKMGWAMNGQIAGTSDIGEKLLDIEVVLVPKGAQGPVSDAPRYVTPLSGRLVLAENATTLVNEDGTGYNGWVSNDHARYYFIDGHALTGWQYVDGYKFYFDSYGRLVQNVEPLIGKQSSYLLKVNKTLNCLTVYAKDGNNGYILPVKAMLTSVGDDTPIGTFYTPEKYRWRLMVNDTYTQYATRITQGFLLHSITYEEPDINKLMTVGYNGLGVTRSLGCVRLTCENSKWIYDNCALGTAVTIYEDPNVASPFDVPELVPLSFEQTWDPTDPLIVR